MKSLPGIGATMVARRAGAVVFALLLLAFTGSGQQGVTPHVGYVYPAGGKQGASFQVRLGGQFLDGVTNVYVSGDGIQARVVDYNKPITQGQFNNLRDEAKKLMEQRQAFYRSNSRRRNTGTNAVTTVKWTTEDEKRLADIRKRISKFVRRPANPAIAETVQVQITIGTNAAIGKHELRLGSNLGLSNPLVFCVGQLPEFSKPEKKESDDPGSLVRVARNREQQEAVPATETRITLPATVNGQILPGGVDRFRFHARKGRQLVVAASARELIPYLADAVPGWFQATLTILDSKGREIAYNDDFKFHPDPVIRFEPPADGEYLVEIKDAIYRGREDFVYRLSIGEFPYITSIFPLGGTVGTDTVVALTGWNLPTNSVKVVGKEAVPGVTTVSVSDSNLLSNLVPFALDTTPSADETEPNNTRSEAMQLMLPAIINGRIDKPGDRDNFAFEGRAGQCIVAEVTGRRLDSPIDSTLRLTDAAGKDVGWNDDREDKGSGLNTHHADSYLRIMLPSTGKYCVQLADSQNQGGPEYAYRLRISEPQPDFELRMVPASINARAGISVPITLYALRKDGFTNEIKVSLNDAPPGFSLTGNTIPAGQDQVRMTLTAATSSSLPARISAEGKALIGGRAVVRQAVPAEDMMQAFAYRHLVPSDSCEVVVTGRGMGRGTIKVPATPVKIPAGGSAKVLLSTSTFGFSDRFDLELSDPPEGISIEKVSSSRDGTEITLKSDSSKIKPGLKGNLIVNIITGKDNAANKKKKNANQQRRPTLGVLPAIAFEVVDGQSRADARIAPR